VDFDVESAAILNNPGSVTAEQAQEYLGLAQQALDCFLTDQPPRIEGE